MFSFLVVLTFVSTAFANPVVSPNTGILGAQISRTAICNPTQEATCMELINNTPHAVAFGFTWTDGGVRNALVTESGTTQCVFAAGPSGTRCVSVLGPDETGWVMFPAGGLVGVQITRWSMPGLKTETLFPLPQNPALPANGLGDPYLLAQGVWATQVANSSCNVNMGDPANRILYVGMCRR